MAIVYRIDYDDFEEYKNAPCHPMVQWWLFHRKLGLTRHAPDTVDFKAMTIQIKKNTLGHIKQMKMSRTKTKSIITKNPPLSVTPEKRLQSRPKSAASKIHRLLPALALLAMACATASYWPTPQTFWVIPLVQVIPVQGQPCAHSSNLGRSND